MDTATARIHWFTSRFWLFDAGNRCVAISDLDNNHIVTDFLLASGLYYLSELVEENSRIAKNVLTQIIYAVVVFQALLTIVDRLPLWLSALSIGSHVLYLQNLRFFPIVRLTDPVFIASCGRLKIAYVYGTLTGSQYWS